MIQGAHVSESTPPLVDTQRLRATANALWPNLRRNRWTPRRETVAYSVTGNPRTGRDYATSTAFANTDRNGETRAWELRPNPGTELLSNNPDIIAYVWPEDWPGQTAYRVTLQQHDHNRAVGTLTTEELFDLSYAKRASRCRQPFHLDTNRHKQPRLRRNDDDGLITPAVARSLEIIASVATLEEMSPEIVDALLAERDVPDAVMIERAARDAE